MFEKNGYIIFEEAELTQYAHLGIPHHVLVAAAASLAAHIEISARDGERQGTVLRASDDAVEQMAGFRLQSRADEKVHFAQDIRKTAGL